MAIIKTSKGQEILVDDDKFEELNQYKWCIHKRDGYAQAHIKIDGKWKSVRMHRYLTNCPKGMVVDHLNEIKLDNRLENLEIVLPHVNTYRYFNKELWR